VVAAHHVILEDATAARTEIIGGPDIATALIARQRVFRFLEH
jgi:hypothetical protein